MTLPASRLALIAFSLLACTAVYAQVGPQDCRPQQRGDAALVEIRPQYFTVRDARFQQALDTVPGLCRPWSANSVRVG